MTLVRQLAIILVLTILALLAGVMWIAPGILH